MKKTETETTVILFFPWMADHLLQVFCSPSLKYFYFYSVYDIFILGCFQHALQLETDLHNLGCFCKKLGLRPDYILKLC